MVWLYTHCYTVRIEVLAKQKLPTAAVEALIAQFRIVGNNSLANCETFYIFADSGDNTDSFMTYK